MYTSGRVQRKPCRGASDELRLANRLPKGVSPEDLAQKLSIKRSEGDRPLSTKQIVSRYFVLNPRAVEIPSPFMVWWYDHPSGCGLEGKAYDIFDMVTPICDSVARLHKSCTGIAGWKSASRKMTAAEDDLLYHPLMAPSSSMHLERAFEKACITYDSEKKVVIDSSHRRCKGCFKTAPDITLEHDLRSGRIICSSCGCDNGVADMGEDGKEKYNDPEKRNPTARVDPHGNQHPVHPAQRPGGTLAGKKRASCGSVVPNEATRALKLGHAQEIANRGAEPPKEDPISKLSRPEKTKLTSVTMQIEKLRVAVHPVDEKIVEEIRRVTGRVFCDSVEHRKYCMDKGSCMLCLYDKPALTIAKKCFLYVLDKLCSGPGLTGVSKQTLTQIHEKCMNHQQFSQQENNVQHEGCLALITTLDTQPEKICQPCPRPTVQRAAEETAPVAPAVSRAARRASKRPSSGGPPMRRQPSNLEDTASSSFLTYLRDAVGKIAREGQFGQSVAKSVTEALTNDEFAAVLKSNAVIPPTWGKFQVAYLLLRAVAEEQAAGAAGGSSEPPWNRISLLQQLGLGNADVLGMVAAIRARLPAPEASLLGGADDSLY